MRSRQMIAGWALAAFAAAILAAGCAEEPGIEPVGPALKAAHVTRTFDLEARDGFISTPEPNSVYSWMFGRAGGTVQYPGPNLIVDQGDVVVVNLVNHLEVPVSIVFPGQSGVAAAGGVPGRITSEAPPGGTVSYTFTARNCGTYIYHGGSPVDLQIEMGLLGAFIVRPPFMPQQAYDHPDTAFDREFLFVMSEMDVLVHELAETGRLDQIDMTRYWPTYWFINGRCAPDTMGMENLPFMPHQPYNCMPMMHPGETILLRFANASRDSHPYHTHGNHMKILAVDGHLMESGKGMGPDLAAWAYTLDTGRVGQLGTADATFTWTGAHLGWDIYGHSPSDPPEPGEYAPDHGKPIPVVIPGPQELQYGAMYSGSPFLGAFGYVPPGDLSPNLHGGYFYMWHSHKEKEMVNNNVFPGGMMTMLIIEHPDVNIGMNMIMR